LGQLLELVLVQRRHPFLQEDLPVLPLGQLQVLVLEQQRRRPCLLVKLLRDPLPLRELVEVRLLQLVGLMHLPIVA
jgi:hypothetical protein